jgi:hypothetical protein
VIILAVKSYHRFCLKNNLASLANFSNFRLFISGQKVLFVEELEGDGWEMVFRASSSNGQNVHDAWTKGAQ